MNSNDASEPERIRRRVTDVVRFLEEFHQDYQEVATDEILRFEMMCEQMFSTFTFRDGPRVGSTFPFSNLDTGDALAHPFPPFVAALQAETEEIAFDAHHYFQPGSIDSLTAAAIQFLKREGFHTRRPLSDLEVLPAAGTVQIYDALCKVHVETSGDTVLVPELGYGFFLTQPCRIGGRVAVAGCDKRGAVSAATLAIAIEEQNSQLWRDWRRDSQALFDRAVRRLAAAGFANFKPNVEGVFADLHTALRGAPEAWRSDEVSKLLQSAAPEFMAPALRARAISILRPPRVVAFLHIQPSVSGHIYTEPEIDALATVLHRGQVVAFEDIAYHSIRCRLRNLPSLQGTAAVAFTLFGLSKPMAIANLRLGLLFVDKAHYDRPKRALESTTGYVSTLLQRALATALRADGFDNYLADLSWGTHGYEARENLMHRLLTGVGSELDDAVRDLVHSVVTSSPMLEPFVDDFLRQGLRRWLRPITRPEAGFFQVLSCAPLLDLPTFRRLGIASSFDVFALLAYAFDLRTIPEEGMRPGPASGRRLRIAFSPHPEVVARLFLRAFAGLSLIEQGALVHIS